MSHVEQCLALTKEIHSLLKQAENGQREEWLEGLNRLFDQRQELFDAIVPPFSEADKEFGKQIVDMNNEIQQLIIQQRRAVQDDLNGLKTKETSMKKYINPYEKVYRDGTFYDQRK